MSHSYLDRNSAPRSVTKKAQASVKTVSSEQERKAAYGIRLRVFVDEQRVPRAIELDRDDAHARHFLAVVSSKAVGTARVVLRRGNAKIGRMAVLKGYRRKGIGTILLKRAVRMARQAGARKIYLHAQVPVIRFYEQLGFRCVGPVFEEAGIPHRKMILQDRTNLTGNARGRTDVTTTTGRPQNLRTKKLETWCASYLRG
jgi:predicted GNAT family N-acyltransferase